MYELAHVLFKHFIVMENLIWQTRDEMDFPSNPLQKLREALSFTSKDLSQNKLDAFLYSIIMGWDDDSYKELAEKFSWSEQDIILQKQWHQEYEIAWNLWVNNNGK